MRTALTGLVFFALLRAVLAQCPPDFAHVEPISTDVEFRVGPDAVRIDVRTTRSGLAAESWKREADQDRDGHVSGLEAQEQIDAELALICEYGLLLEIRVGAREQVMALRLENRKSNIGVEVDDPVSIQFDFVACGFVPVAGGTYSGSLVYSNPFISAAFVHTSVVAGEGVRFLSAPGSLAESATFAMGRGLSGEFSFVVKDHEPLPVGREETSRPGMLALLLGTLGYIGVLVFVTRRR